MKRSASAEWKGSGLEGSGTITTQSNVLTEQPYSLQTRFKDESGKSGTNPEELLAAAHAACFNMALSFMLSAEGHPPQSLNTQAQVDMDTSGKDFRITRIQLSLKARVEGINREKLEELAQQAKQNCPISAALQAVPIKLSVEINP